MMPHNKMIALVMCGGKGTRLRQFEGIEKPLLDLKGKTMIEYVLDALIHSQKFRRIVAVSSPFSSKTTTFLYHHPYYSNGLIDVIESEGAGYSKDLSFVLNKLKPNRVLTVPADLPLLNSNMVDQVVIHNIPRFSCASIILEKHFVENIGITPSIVFNIGAQQYCHSGIIVFNSPKLKECQNIKEYFILMNKKEIAVNVNTLREIQLAERLLP
jgi:adenosylcobinamide-phosphate guanylyltransferase